MSRRGFRFIFGVSVAAIVVGTTGCDHGNGPIACPTPPLVVRDWPEPVGPAYFGLCADPELPESNALNNCSRGLKVTTTTPAFGQAIGLSQVTPEM